MDRDGATDPTAGQTLIEIHEANPAANLPGSPVVVSVCITCKTADGSAVVGPEMYGRGKGCDRATRCRDRGASGAMPQRLQAPGDGRGDEP